MSATHEVDLEEVRPSQRGSILKDMDEIEKMGIPFFAKFFGKKLGGWKNDEGKKENAESVVTADFKKAMYFRFNMNQARGIETVDDHGHHKIQRVEPGKREPASKLYPLWGTSINDLGDFGLGIGLYFRTLQAIAILLLICFFINIPVMTHFAYNFGQYDFCKQTGDDDEESTANCASVPVPQSIMGTAWCPNAPITGDEAWVDEDWVKSYIRKVKVTHGNIPVTDTSEFKSARIYECPFHKTQAICDFTSTLFTLIFIFALGKIQDEQVDQIDEGVQTSQDYSVEVEDPGDGPMDNDPNQWKRFFEQFGQVTGITIAKKNGKLMKLLCQRKILLSRADKMGWDNKYDEDYVEDAVRRALQKGDHLPDDAFTGNRNEESGQVGNDPWEPNSRKLFGVIPVSRSMVPYCQAVPMLGLFHDIPMVARQIEKKNTEIFDEVKVLLEKVRSTGFIDNARVYVTFQSEEAQRKCLKAMSCGTVAAFLEWKKTDAERLFWNQPKPTREELYKPMTDDPHQGYVGEFGPVNQADEDKYGKADANVLGVTQAPEPGDINWENLDKEPYEVYLTSLIFTSVGLAIVAIMAALVFALGPYAPVFIACCNGALPTIMKILNGFEPHPNQTNQEASLLFKLVAARWTITGLVVYVTTSWADTVTDKRIGATLGLLFADALTTPTIRLLDVSGTLNKYVLGPMAKTQEGMDASMKGTGWFLAERFSDMTKTVFVCYFYSALIPSAYLIAAFALFYNFWVDKYCLLRVWQVKPPLDAKIVATTRAHLALIVVIHCITTLHYFAGWPFDGIVCKGPDGNFLKHTQEECNGHYELDDGTYKTYAKRTEMNLWNAGDFIYFNRRGYMDDDQRYSVVLYMVIAFLAIILVTTCYFGGTFGFTLYTLFVGFPADNSQVAKHPEDKDEDYFIPGYAGKSIDISLAETDAYLPQIMYPGIDNPQLALYHPEMDLSEPPKGPDGKVDVSRSWFPKAMLSWNESKIFGVFYNKNNLYLDEILDNPTFDIRSEDEKRKLFTSCNIFEPIKYAPGEGWAKGGHVMSAAATVESSMGGIPDSERRPSDSTPNPLAQMASAQGLTTSDPGFATIPDPAVAGIPDPEHY